ncbi:MAG: hypothetical protein M0Z58_09690 [Nitrospiraceae bacterium]|nr:hypothetical protein [Nitrospiraceae bacterium]
MKPAAVSAVLFLFILPFFILPCRGFASGRAGLAGLQRRAGISAGQRIAFFAERFLGTPYDTDPIGLYVARKAIVADDRVDCMYLVFRAVELALSSTPEGARNLALTMRFRTKGRLGPDGKVLNYADRYRYGLDMILSGKWGSNITASLGKPLESLETSARFQKMGVPKVLVLPRKEIDGALAAFKSGDIVFFVKDPGRRAAQEVIGHMGILAVRHGHVWLIHAHGSKVHASAESRSGIAGGLGAGSVNKKIGNKKNGKVVKILFRDYVKKMPFIGIMVTRFD